MTAEITRFLQAIRPSGQGYVLTLNAKQPGQSVFASNKDAVNVITQSIEKRQDVFVSLAQFQKGSAKREKKYAEHLASVWVDLDCGNRKPYATQQDALDALQAFLETTDLPKPSMLVNSGGGIHAYWAFTQIIGKADWEPCANAFKTMCIETGLQIDKAVTADAARVMRVPSSQNMKLAGNPRPVFIIEPEAGGDIAQIDFDEFFDALKRRLGSLPTSVAAPPPSALNTAAHGPLNSITKALLGNAETPENIQKVVSALDSIDPDISYPDWFRILCAVKSTDWDCAEQTALTWSAKGAKFDADVFEKQWREIKTYGGVSVGSLFHMAQQGGWQPNSTVTTPDQPGDIRNGRAFAAMHRDNLLFVKPMAKWFRWDGNRWAICTCGEEMEAAKETAKQLLDDAAQVAAADPDKGKRLFAHALQTQNLPRLEAMIRLASSEPGMVIGNASELDADPWLLGVKNGVVNLRTGTLLAPDPKMLITKQCNATYTPEADCPRWLAFLGEIFDDDLETIAAARRLLGYTLTGITDEEVMVICHGHGANGKSVFSNVVCSVIGEYYTVGPNCLLVARDKSDNSVRNDLAKLLGARLISVNELTQGARLDEQVIKQLAGREPMSARFLHKEFFDFQPTGKVWLRTNHRPIVTGEDDGIWRRLVLIPFKRKFSEEERDTNLEAKLLEEREGILAWMVQGALNWQTHGLHLSPTIMAESKAYRTDSDLLGEFLDDKTTPSPKDRVEQAILFRDWKEWCDRDGLKAGSKKRFTNKLTERGYVDSKSNGKRFYDGLKRN